MNTETAFGGYQSINAARTAQQDEENVEIRCSVRREISESIGLAGELHDVLSQLVEELTPVLGPEMDVMAKLVVNDNPIMTTSELVLRGQAHNRSLREAISRLHDLRGRLEV